MASTSHRPPPIVQVPDYDAVTDVLSYISRLDLDDIESLQSRSRNKQRDEEVLSDEELAMLLFAEEAEGLLNITKEYRAEDSTEPRSMLQELLELEEAARYDHQVALAISEGRPIPPRPERHIVSSTSDMSLFVTEPAEEPESDSDSSSIVSSEDDTYLPSSSSSSIVDIADVVDDRDEAGPSFPFSPTLSVVEDVDEPCCTICGDVITGIVIEAPCGHSYDTTCMGTMFSKASKDESLYPPRCCLMPIPSTSVRQYLGAKVMMDFDQRALEFDTPAGSRVYCHLARCSAFIGASTEEPSSLPCTDPECTTQTCGSCKQEAHPDVSCSHNKEVEERELTQMASELHEEKGWQRCYSCHHLVEKSEGCYHITCICKAQFCYLCATKWKECSCPQFEVPPELIGL